MNVHNVHGHVGLVLGWLNLPDWAAECEILTHTAARASVETTTALHALVVLFLFMLGNAPRKRLDPAVATNMTTVLVACRRQQALCPPMANAHPAMVLIRVRRRMTGKRHGSILLAY